MSIHFRDDVEGRNDAILRVVTPAGGLRGGPVIRVDLPGYEKGNGTPYVQFSLSPQERAMLIGELTPAPAPIDPEAFCYHDDHMPGCEHPPAHEPWCPMFHQRSGCTCGAEAGPDPADATIGRRA